MLNKVWI